MPQLTFHSAFIRSSCLHYLVVVIDERSIACCSLSDWVAIVNHVWSFFSLVPGLGSGNETRIIESGYEAKYASNLLKVDNLNVDLGSLTWTSMSEYQRSTSIMAAWHGHQWVFTNSRHRSWQPDMDIDLHCWTSTWTSRPTRHRHRHRSSILSASTLHSHVRMIV